MKFLVDAQLPYRFVVWLTGAGHDALHTLDLPLQNHTPDNEVIARAILDDRVIISKDDDFVQSFLITGEPRLLLISTGNITNTDLEKIVRANLSRIEAAFVLNRFIEITRDTLMIHD